ncbi:CASTOR/POLLUX-related putative ion channel [Ilumatobacter nonamiensis]|uniref:CASTOR/POLLUX-related putative ion channel n=1 Tax=Ilumatobacter nonamiensis TaxID=467093 RepID=UPI00034848C4|nr:hypothetical protein [Ilumatobacter nonamiensis]
MSDGDLGREDRGGTEPGLRERFRYRFDNLLARGTSATLIWLGAVTFAAVLVSSVLLSLFGASFSGSEGTRWVEDAWQSLLRVMDPGTMAGDVGWGRRILALVVTIFGLLVAGTLIGIIAAGVEDRIEQMRRGRSVVIESDHVVVLGASDRLPAVVSQLAIAGAEGGSRTIVVLADIDPTEVHEATREAAGLRSGSKVEIVYRAGDPTVPDDLALVRLATARAVVVLSDGRTDASALATVLAIAAERGALDDVTVVVELLEVANAERLQRAYGRSVHPIVTSEAIARTTAFALRQRGLHQVLRELLDFRGDDLHFVERPDLVGASFGRLVRGFCNARPIALRRVDGTIQLAPPLETRVGSGDQIVVIADDGRVIDVVDRGDEVTLDRARSASAGSGLVDEVRSDERLVMVGWNERGRQMLSGWAVTAAPTSRFDLIVDPQRCDIDTIDLPDLGPISARITPSADGIGTAIEGDPTTLVLLAAQDEPDEADIGTILDLQALRRELDTRDGSLRRPRLVVELHDAANEPLVGLDGPDDLIISDAVGSQFVAQLVDEPERREVLLALYSPEGAVVRLVRCDHFDLVGEHEFAEVVDRVASRDELAIGWRLAGDPGVVLNPMLTARVRFSADDELIVVG